MGKRYLEAAGEEGEGRGKSHPEYSPYIVCPTYDLVEAS
jgi:hypothetical protein